MTIHRVFWLAAVPFVMAVGCGSGENDNSSTSDVGGSTGVGGALGKGGQTERTSTGGSSAKSSRRPDAGGSASGGTKTSGGLTSAAVTAGGQSDGGSASGEIGGAKATGGAKAAGGAKATGGAKAAGGAKATGGAKAAGGSSNPAGTAGGTKFVDSSGTGGGSNPSGGTKAAGGSPAGGAASGGGGAGGSTAASASPGCGIASPLKTGTFTETVNGTARKWMLDVPSSYDGTKPYRLIFVWHPLGGSGSQVVNGGFDGLKSLANNTAIFATADGLNGKNAETSGVGWWNADGGDMKLVQVMLDKINAGLCVDQKRIFSTGFSFGGMMSYTLPFVFDVFRAVAPCSGKTGVIPYESKFSGPVPIMAFHGNNDTFVATSLGKAFLDLYRKRNGCGSETKPVDPSPCVEYQGCTVPTMWCEFSGGHAPWSGEPKAIWDFFSKF